MPKASEGLSDQISKTGNAQNRLRKKFFASFYKADFLPKHSIVQGQRGTKCSQGLKMERRCRDKNCRVVRYTGLDGHRDRQTWG